MERIRTSFYRKTRDARKAFHVQSLKASMPDVDGTSVCTLPLSFPAFTNAKFVFFLFFPRYASKPISRYLVLDKLE